jgi:hypothetical protein
MTATRLIAGGSIGVEASLNKIFWSSSTCTCIAWR